MATLYKRGDRYYLNWRDGGVQVRRSLGAIDRKAAETLRAEKEAELRGLITPTRGMRLGALLDAYMGWYRSSRPTTYKRAVSALKRFRAAFDHLPAETIPPESIERWAATQSAKGQTEKALKLARAALRDAIRKRRIGFSPMDAVKIEKPLVSRAPPYYRREQLRALAKTPRGALWIFMAATGPRRGEMVKAMGDDIRDGVFLIESEPGGRTKSGKWRAVPLNRYAIRALRKLGEGRLANCHADTLGDWFKADAAQARVPGSLHWLRHTFCTVLAQQGVSLHDIKQLAGHSSITVTEKYAHHQPSYGRSAVATMGGWQRPKAHEKAQARAKSLRPRSSAG